ncbi:hypothetical protein JCM6882_002288 [Rhodosporidiobolus microsporus]
MHSLTSLFALALLPAAALAAPAPAKQQEAVRLVGRAPSPVNAGNVEQAITASLERLSRRAEQSTEPQVEKRGYKVPIKNVFNDGAGIDATTATIQVGTPAQDVSVMFDTGSPDFFIPVTCGTNCAAGFFGASKSSTFRNKTVEYTIEYAAGASATGNLATDKVSVGGLAVEQQAFLAATEQVVTKKTDFAGVFGLGYHGPSLIGSPSFLDNLLASKQLAGNRFSLYFNRETDGSELILGGVDSSKYEGSFTTVGGLNKGPHWSLRGQGYTVDGKPAYRIRTQTFVDSGSNINIVPRAVAAAIYRDIPDQQNGTFTLNIGGTPVEVVAYNFPCDAAVSVGFTFQDGKTLKTLEMDKRDFVGANYGDGYCDGTVYGADYRVNGEVVALLGSPFLRSFYSVFSFGEDGNTPSISFAKSK